MTESDNAYTLQVNLPELSGRTLNDMELSVEGDLLSLHIPQLTLPQVENLKAVWEEIPSDERREHFRIPSTVNIEEINATLQGEHLQVILPKRTPVKYTIQIGTNKAS